jgi:hypothetical protein
MRNLLLGIVIVLLLAGVGFIVFKVALKGPLSGLCSNAPLPFISSLCPSTTSGGDITVSKATFKCSWADSSCSPIVPSANSGNLKITVTVNGEPGKKIEIDTWTSPQPGGDKESFVKYTDQQGIAFFEGIPAGIYYLTSNTNSFPKQYTNAWESFSPERVEVAASSTTERSINLVTTP